MASRRAPGDEVGRVTFESIEALEDALAKERYIAGRDLSADVWHPSPGLAHSDGTIRPEFLWAALDCAGGIGAAGDSFNCQPYVLGRLSARLLGPVTAGEPHVVVGWRLATEGRKIMAGSALFTAGGQAVAVARATWIRLRRPASECCPR